MGLFLFMIAQLTSMLVSTKIKADTYKKIYKNIGDAGYKIDVDKIEQIQQEEQKQNKLLQAIETFLFLIPGVNIVSSLAKRIYDTKKTGKLFEKYEVLIPMSEIEYNNYQKLPNILSKVSYVVYSDELNKQYEADLKRVKIYLGDKDVVLEDSIAQLYYDRLPALSYTLDEVKKLSDSIELYYKLGKMDGINTAIIGLPNEECNITTTIVKKDDSLEKHDYEIIKEEYMQNERFVIYPFGIDFNENDKLKACYEEILKDRDNYYKNKKSKIMNYNFYPTDNKPFVRVKQK